VQNILINTLVVVSSRELWGQASVVYKSIGKRFRTKQSKNRIFQISTSDFAVIVLNVLSIVGTPKRSSASEIYTEIQTHFNLMFVWNHSISENSYLYFESLRDKNVVYIGKQQESSTYQVDPE